MNQDKFVRTDLSLSNRRLLELNQKRRQDLFLNPELIYPWWRRCPVRVLLVTDGGLDFGQGDFGLSAFVEILKNDAPAPARFQMTLAHLRSDVTDAQVMNGAPGIMRSIKGFRFDEPAHFDANMYDEVWLFGIETSFHPLTPAHPVSYAQRNADRVRYPANRLGDNELRALSAHMKRGGVFATGDHGALGRGLCGSVPRVRSMRYWDSFPSTNPTEDQVSMDGPRRNDTNHAGHDVGSQFSDQSDDIPQPLDLVLYSTPYGVLRSARYPHPVLCGRMGRINVFPDHPHEGECRVPGNLTVKFDLDSTDEYPVETGGTTRISPEVIAYSHVPAGNTADKGRSKQPTVAHRFGAISAYDGHRAGVGRVICDATWHHFINVNLIGVVEGGIFDQFDLSGGDHHPGEHSSKHDGFLSSAAGMAALDKIKNYFTNVGVWLAPPPVQRCFNQKYWWQLVYADRIMEATLVDPNVEFKRIPTSALLAIGIHARDALGRRASQCQTVEWIIDWFKKLMPEFIPWIDPWDPIIRVPKDAPAPLPFFDPWPAVHVALGAALVAMRQAFPYPPEKANDDADKAAEEAALKGARVGLGLAVEQAGADWKVFSKALKIN